MKSVVAVVLVAVLGSIVGVLSRRACRSGPRTVEGVIPWRNPVTREAIIEHAHPGRGVGEISVLVSPEYKIVPAAPPTDLPPAQPTGLGQLHEGDRVVARGVFSHWPKVPERVEIRATSPARSQPSPAAATSPSPSRGSLVSSWPSHFRHRGKGRGCAWTARRPVVY